MNVHRKGIVNNIVYKCNNILAVDIAIAFKNENEKAVARGFLNSGTHLDMQISMVSAKIECSIKTTLSEVLQLQDSLNFRYTKKELKYITELMKNSLTSFAKQQFDNGPINTLRHSFGSGLSEGIIEPRKNGLMQNISGLTDMIITDDVLKRKVAKKPADIRQMFFQNLVAFIALIIAIAGLLISILKE